MTNDTALATRPTNGAVAAVDISDVATILERAILGGDLSGMKPDDRLRYYEKVCRSLRLNPLTKPFQYVTLRSGGPMILYPTMECAQQLRKMYGVSCVVLSTRRDEDDIYTVTVLATLPSGRREQCTGQLFVGGLRGQALADARMKAESKAKRRATFAILGLGYFDEVEAAGRVTVVNVDDTPGHRTELPTPVVPDDLEAPEAIDGDELEGIGYGVDAAPPVSRALTDVQSLYEPAVAQPLPTATPPAAERPTPAMWTRWAALWQEAQALKLEVASLSKANATRGQLLAAGQALAGRIAEAKGILAREQAEAGAR